MRNLVWDDDATAQFESLLGYVAERNFAAAERLESLVHERIEMIRAFADMGWPGRIDGTKELVVHPNYIVIYRESPNLIEVIRVLHARQRYP